MPTSTELTDAQRQRQMKAKADQLEIDIRDLRDTLRYTTCKRERKQILRDIDFTEGLLCDMCC